MFSAILSMTICSWSLGALEQPEFLGRSVDAWRAIVRSETATPAERRDAVWALGCFGEDARQAAPDLIELVHRGDLKDEAIGALNAMGVHRELAVPGLIERFVKEGCQHRTAMGAIGFNPGTEQALVGIGGPAVPSLVEILKGPDRDMRVCAAAALGRIGPAARRAIPDLIQAATGPEKDYLAEVLRDHAVIALGQIGAEARAMVPTLSKWLEASKQGKSNWPGPERSDLVTALNRIGFPPVSMLVDELQQGKDPAVAMELAGLGSNAREAIPALRKALSDRRRNVRVSAAIALAQIDHAAETVPVLTDALNTPDDEYILISWVIDALARVGPGARAALPRLIALVDKGYGGDLCKALVQIDPEGKSCVPTLIRVLKDEDYVESQVAADSLSLLGPGARDSVPALAIALTREFGESFGNGYEPQASAARALRRIGPAARSAIPALIAALKFRDHVRPHAGGFNDMIEAADQSDCTGAAASAEVLGSFGAEAKGAVPALIESVQSHEKDDQSWPVRLKAIEALGRIGPDARPAIPVLRDLMKEKQRDSQYLPVILAALYRLAPDGKELAENWLDATVKQRKTSLTLVSLHGRAMLLGVMGRTSVEADYFTRNTLSTFDWFFADAGQEADDPPMPVAEWFEKLAEFGVGSRKAIPRLREFQRHPSPWVRMWATEALSRITANQVNPPPVIDRGR